MARQYRIKRAESPTEIEAAARVVAAAVRESYEDLVSPQVFQILTGDELIVARVEQWWRATLDGAHLWLAQHAQDGRTLAMAFADVSTEADAPTPLELKMLFALEDVKGSGLADALLQTSIGDAPAHLWTFSGNDRAIGFYRKHGFALDGVARVADHVTQGRDGIVAPIEVRLVRLG